MFELVRVSTSHAWNGAATYLILIELCARTVPCQSSASTRTTNGQYAHSEVLPWTELRNQSVRELLRAPVRKEHLGVTPLDRGAHSHGGVAPSGHELQVVGWRSGQGALCGWYSIGAAGCASPAFRYRPLPATQGRAGNLSASDRALAERNADADSDANRVNAGLREHAQAGSCGAVKTMLL